MIFQTMPILIEIKIMSISEVLLNAWNPLLMTEQMIILTITQGVIKYNVLQIYNQLQLLLLKSIKLLSVQKMMKEKTYKFNLGKVSLDM
jgi:hypothetical protein